MNTKNNQRFQESERKIQMALMDLLKTGEPQNITIQNICETAQINRTTFYTHFSDICALTEKCEAQFRLSLRESMNKKNAEKNENSQRENQIFFLELIKKHKEFYRFYFLYHKTNPEHDGPSQVWLKAANCTDLLFTNHYRIVFYQAGIEAILSQWIENDCIDDPARIQELLKQRLPENFL